MLPFEGEDDPPVGSIADSVSVNPSLVKAGEKAIFKVYTPGTQPVSYTWKLTAGDLPNVSDTTFNTVSSSVEWTAPSTPGLYNHSVRNLYAQTSYPEFLFQVEVVK